MTSNSLLNMSEALPALLLRSPTCSAALQGDPGEGMPSEEAQTAPIQKVALK